MRSKEYGETDSQPWHQQLIGPTISIYGHKDEIY